MLAGCAAVLLAGCGDGAASDLGTVAASIQTIDQQGADFSITVTETATGGDIPKGKVARGIYHARGQEKDDKASFVLGAADPTTGRNVDAFDLVVSDSDVYVRPHASTRDWYLGWTYVAEDFIPGVRLNLLRESVLLATRISKSTTFSNGSFSNQYTITPAHDQLVQLVANSGSGFLVARIGGGNRLQGVDGHFSGIDPVSSRHLLVSSTLTFSNIGRAAEPQVPKSGVPVPPAELFSTAAVVSQ